MTRALVLSNVEVEAQRVDVVVRDGFVAEITPAGHASAGTGKEVIAGHGGALLPGLHDHHLHLNAMAARSRSLDLGAEAVAGSAGVTHALREATPVSGWVRAVDYHESVAGELNRDVLDYHRSDVPVRVQHRSGALWMLNSAALDLVEAHLDHGPDVERDDRGMLTGRLWRYDTRLAAALPDETQAQRVALTSVRDDLFSLGITGVTDATPDMTVAGMELLRAVAPLRVTLLGVSGVSWDQSRAAHMAVGPRKILLPDHDLPTYDGLRNLIAPHEGPRRPVAVHCVTQESLVMTTAALAEVGVTAGDRIEHAAVVPDELLGALRALGVTVVTQPDFLRTRGDAYLREVAPQDRDLLYRWGGLTRAGIPVVGSSDAPFGNADPWQVMRSARDRRTMAGEVVRANEAVPTSVALASYLTPPHLPPGPTLRLTVGAPADLCLLSIGRDEALDDPHRRHVAATLVAGAIRYWRSS